MRKNPEPNEIYRHFKGNLYQVKCIASDSENGHEMVVYQALYEPYGIYVRPLDMFMSETDHVKYPNASEVYRFTLVGRAGDMKPAESQITADKPKAAEQPNVAEQSKAAGQSQLSEQSKPDIRCENEEDNLDPAIAAFLDADTCEKKLTILDSMHERITDNMINTMAVASDLEINEGDLETRFDDLRSCLMTMGRFDNLNRRQ